jgi:hypothetical protein
VIENLAVYDEYEAQIFDTAREDSSHAVKGMRKSVKEISDFYGTMLEALGKVGETQKQITQELFKQSKA